MPITPTANRSTTTPPGTETVEYHYILTVQQGASQMSVSTGTVTITPGVATRAQVLAHLQEENNAPPAQWAVVFFSLERNALGGVS